MQRYGKNADLKFFERTDDVEKWECLTIDWRAKEPDAARHISHYRLNEEQKNQMRLGISGGQEIKKQQAYPMHKYALWPVYLFTFQLSPNDKMKVP